MSRPAFGGEQTAPSGPKQGAKRNRGTFVASTKSEPKKKQIDGFDPNERFQSSSQANDNARLLDEEDGDIIFDLGSPKRTIGTSPKQAKQSHVVAAKPSAADNEDGDNASYSGSSSEQDDDDDDESVIYYKRVRVGIIDVRGDWKIAETGRTQQRVNPDYITPYLIGFTGTIKERLDAAKIIKQKKLYEPSAVELSAAEEFHKQRYFFKWLPKDVTGRYPNRNQYLRNCQQEAGDAKILAAAEFAIYDTLQERIRSRKAKAHTNEAQFSDETESNLDGNQITEGKRLAMSPKKSSNWHQAYMSRQSKLVQLINDNGPDHRYGILALAHLHRMCQTVYNLESRERIFQYLADHLNEIKSRTEKNWLSRCTESSAQMELILIEISRRKTELSDGDLLAYLQRCLQRFPDHPWVMEYVLDALECWLTSPENTFPVVQRHLTIFLDILNLARIRGAAAESLSSQEQIDLSLLGVVARSIVLNLNAGYIGRGRTVLMAYIHTLIFLHVTTATSHQQTSSALFTPATTIETICQSNLSTSFPFLDELDGLTILSGMTGILVSDRVKNWFEKLASSHLVKPRSQWNDPFISGVLSRLSLSRSLIGDRDMIKCHLSHLARSVLNLVVLSEDNSQYVRNMMGRVLFTLGVCLFPTDYTWLYTALNLLEFPDVQCIIQETNMFQSATDPRVLYSFLVRVLFESGNRNKGFKAARHSLSIPELLRDHSYLVSLTLFALRTGSWRYAVIFLASPALGNEIIISDATELADMPIEESLQWWLAERRLLGLTETKAEEWNNDSNNDSKIDNILRYGYLNDQPALMATGISSAFDTLQTFDTSSTIKLALFLLLTLTEIKRSSVECDGAVVSKLSYDQLQQQYQEYGLLQHHESVKAGEYISMSMKLLRPYMNKLSEMSVIRSLILNNGRASDHVVGHWLELLAETMPKIRYESRLCSELSQRLKDVQFWSSHSTHVRVSQDISAGHILKIMSGTVSSSPSGPLVKRLGLSTLLRIVERLLDWTEEDTHFWRKHYLGVRRLGNSRMDGYDLLAPKDAWRLLTLMRSKLGNEPEAHFSDGVFGDRVRLLVHRILMRSRFVHESHMVAQTMLSNINKMGGIEIGKEMKEIGLYSCCDF